LGRASCRPTEVSIEPAHAGSKSLFLCFFVLGVSLAPFAVFLEIDLTRDELAILARPIIDTAALRARELEKLILRHIERHYTRYQHSWQYSLLPMRSSDRIR